MNNEDERILEELKTIKNEIGHFLTLTELYELGCADLYVAIDNHGGINMSHWTEESVLKELKKIKSETGHFTMTRELYELDRSDLSNAIGNHGGINKFKEHFVGYWTYKTTIEELKGVMIEIGHFPTVAELRTLGRGDLLGAINKHGGINRFKALFGEEVKPRFPNGYWTDETIIEGLRTIKNMIGHFPTPKELSAMGRSDLRSAINKHGGINRFLQLIGTENTHATG